jgi:beta-fructofuranosidase
MRRTHHLLLVVIAGACVWADEPARTSAADDWRPAWHIAALPREGLCMPYDPNGAIYSNGKYHLMYIYQDPKLARNGRAGDSYGHASSTDLVNWTFHTPALQPNPVGGDSGIYSGNAFLSKEGKPTMAYLGLDAGVCIATAQDDNLIHWKKQPQNPVIRTVAPGQPGYGDYTPWDPHVWLERDTYYCISGNTTVAANGKPPYLLKSGDLVNWTPLHPLYDPTPLIPATEDFACPDMFRLGNKYVLMGLNHRAGGRAYVGRFENEKFIPEQYVGMNWPGGTFFAPESLEDANGRRVFWGWVMDPRLYGTKAATGSGVMSMPRELSLDADGTLRIKPAVELQSLRRNSRTISTIQLAANTEAAIPNIRGVSLEINVEIDPGDAREVGVKVRCSPDGTEETVIAYDTVAKTLKIDMSRSTLRTDVVYQADPLALVYQDQPRTGAQPCGDVVAPFALGLDEMLNLRIFLDGPMLEVFANDRQCLTQQIFPSNWDALGIKAFARGGAATLLWGQAWDMAPAMFVDETQLVPEPGMCVLFLTGSIGMAAYTWCKQQIHVRAR